MAMTIAGSSGELIHIRVFIDGDYLTVTFRLGGGLMSDSWIPRTKITSGG